MEMNNYKKYEPFFNSWYITKMIGEGSFGKVYEVEREDFGRKYKSALKKITIPQNQNEIKSAMADGMDEKSTRAYFRGLVEDLISEFDIMTKIKGNTNIVSYCDFTIPYYNYEFDEDGEMFSNRLSIAVANGDEFLQRINNQIEAYTKDATISALEDRYITN